jgi:hypothetical protein
VAQRRATHRLALPNMPHDSASTESWVETWRASAVLLMKLMQLMYYLKQLARFVATMGGLL